MSNRIVSAALALAATVSAAGLLAAGSSGGTEGQRTIGIVFPDPNTGAPLSREVEHGASAAASALGDDLVTIPADGPAAMTSAVKSLIAQHAAAIAVTTDQGPDTVKQVLPVLAQARAAGIPTLSFPEQFPGSVWVSQSTPDQYAQALADALSSQMGERGQYAIVACAPHTSIVPIWLKDVEAYVLPRYPRMKRVAVAYGDTGNGDGDTHMFRRLIKRHPHLRGMIFLCPGESYILPQQVIQAHKVGKVFTAGNGGDCPPLSESETPLPHYVRLGAEVIVCAGDPVKLGYLVVWAADYLARGQTFASGQYDVGGSVGTVSYDATDTELPLGQPLTITKANVDQYTSP
jgi:ABC-type sugar transport system substrate-binding protein